ncbi:hypothetical protein KMZ32_05645 [Phycicoccus sp. MAQZ13P-2]|uniref:hypothetical protein n=1 Tax=Phycicoccus mangrovi TaxID=2840470 RepID=UPI001C003C11|nr:hypothetical protein [Phycicoccus mangrovi]MBT9273560.1 hypothetical protein [Phycicoccus mangrovi]
MLPHARAEITALAHHSAPASQGKAQGWNVQLWELTEEDVARVGAAYRALLAVAPTDELSQLLVDMGIDALGPVPSTDQHAKVARADAMELAAAATALSVDGATIDTLHMPNIPKMAGMKSDSGIDIVGVELDPTEDGELVDGERLLIVSVKHTTSKYASGMRGKLEKSISEDLSGPYLYRQLTTVHGRMIQSGVTPETAQRVFHFLRETLTNPKVRLVCVAAAAPPPDCNLPDQPSQLLETQAPDAHFRMLLVPKISSLHRELF